MVAAGVGCTLLPLLAAPAPAPSESLLVTRPFAKPAPYRTIGLVYRRGFPRAETVRAFATLIHGHMPSGVEII